MNEFILMTSCAFEKKKRTSLLESQYNTPKSRYFLAAILVLLLNANVYLFAQERLSKDMESRPYNFKHISPEQEQSTHFLWKELNDKKYFAHPEFGRLPADAPCENCIEIYEHRTATIRYFVDLEDTKKFMKQTSYGDLHHWDGRFWITIDHRLKPKSNQQYESLFPLNPITIMTNEKKVSMEQNGKSLFFNDWKLFKKHQGTISLIHNANWSNYTAGDDGIYVIDIFPGIDAEFIVYRGAIKTNFIVKPTASFGAFDQLIFRDHFALSSGLATKTIPEEANQTQEFSGAFVVADNQGNPIVHYNEAVGYLQKEKSNTNTVLTYRIADDYADLMVDASWLNPLLNQGAVVIDPIVTGTATLAQASIGGSQFNLTCNFFDSCNHNLEVGIPANATLNNVTFSFNYFAQGWCWLEDGAIRVSTGSCVFPAGNFVYGCGATFPGTCNIQNVGIFSTVSPCLPAPSCSVQNITFTLLFYRSCWGSLGCNNTCIGAATPFSVTIFGNTVEPANVANPITVSSTTVCQGQSITASTTVQNGIAPYTYSWSFDPTGIPAVASGQSTSITFPTSGSTTLYSVVTDNCGVESITSININVTPGVVPTFNAVGPYCSGATIPALPTTSLNGILGAWSPALNNSSTTSYTFTPNSGQCAAPTTTLITIDNCGYEGYASAVWVDDCSNQQFSDGQFYNTSGSGIDLINPFPNNDFHNRYFGQFVQNSNVFWLRGAEIKTNKNPAGSNVCIPKLYYRVYQTATAPGAFLPASGWDINFRANCDLGLNSFAPFSGAPCSLAGQQLWQCVSQPDCSAPVNLTQYPPGDYTLEVYFELPGSQTTTNLCNDLVFINNSGENYKATFTIVNPGLNGTLAICQGDVPTPAQLFGALNGTPSQGGTWTNSGNVYTYTVSPTPCNPASATVTVVPQNPPNAGTNGTLTLCQGVTPTPAQLFAALGGSPDPGGSWTNSGNVYTYTVTPIAPCTNSASATVTINFTAIVTPTFNTVGPYCVGTTIPALPTTSQNGITGTWSPGINSTATTTYTFTPTAGQCATTTTMVITVNQQPPAPSVLCYQTPVWNAATCVWDIIGTHPNVPPMDLGPDITICQGQSTTLSAPAGYNSYLWSNGSTNQSITVNQSGTYSVTGSVNVPSSINLVSNPGFDQGNTGFTSNYNVGTGGPWGTVSNGNTYAIVTNPVSAHVHLANCPYQGNMLVANGGNIGNNANVWCQTIAITPNTNYIFSVDAINPHNNAGWGVLPLTLNLVINGTNVGSLTPPMSPNNCNWQTYSSSVWNSGTMTSVTICVQNATNTASLLAIDNLSFSPVQICTYTDEINVNISPNITPTFAQVGPYCSGATIPALPTTSQNAITGTWSPALNNSATTTYTFTPTAGQCATPTTMVIAISPNITPTFAQVGPYCSGATIPALPTTSQNGITGTWSPALNNSATTTYTFTPTAGQCATPTTMVITISPNITPTFAQAGPYCTGATIPALPTISQNGITGTWSPALNNSATTTYTFTPTVGQCATPTTMVITISPNITPTFAQVGPYCSGATIPALPTTSQNGITGTWSPALNNSATTTYTFTPTAGQCATPTTMVITISPNITPTFAQVGPYCTGATIPALPTTSQNGITGTWSPSLNNSATTTYTFTPTAGQCATPTTMVITISPNITPTFAPVGPYCSGATIPALTTTSQNGITGTWSPALNNSATTTYTFMPTAGQCAISTILVITINVTQVQITCPPATTVACNVNNLAPYANLAAFQNDGGTVNAIGGSIVPGSFGLLTQSAPTGVCPETITRTYIISDDCGNSATCTQQITVFDNVSPTGIAPANLNLQCVSQVPNPNVNLVTGLSDNCGTPTVTHLSDVSNNQTCPQIITRTYRITDACGNFVDVTQTITINDNTPPSGNAPSNLSVQCAAGIPAPNVNSLTNVSDNCGTPTVTHLSDVSNNQTCPQIITRTYRITDACGNFTDVVQTITVNDNTPPSGTAPANITVLCASAIPPQNTNSVTNISDNCSTPAVAFVGDVSNGNVCNQEVITRTYSITDACGNQTLVNQLITIQAVTPSAQFSSTNPSTCQGNDGQILISGLLPSQAVTITLNNQNQNHSADAQGQIVIGGLTQGNYFISQIIPLNCVACVQTVNQTLTLSDPPSPIVDAGNDITVCEGESVTLTAFNPSNASISWSNGVQNGVSFIPTLGTNIYTVTAELLNCFSSDEVVVTVNPLPNVDAGPMQSICEGNTVVLTATGAATYEWNNGVINGVPFQQNEPTVIYSVIGTTAQGCSSLAHVLVNIFENPTPVISLSQTSACNVPVELFFSVSSAEQPVICYWNFGDGYMSGDCENVSHTYTELGCFDVSFQVTYGNGCMNSAFIEDAICITQGPTAAFVFNPDEPNVGDPIQILNLSQNATNYQWDLGMNSSLSTQTNITFSYEIAGVYEITLIAFDAIGCTDTTRIEINIGDGLVMYVPNTFTPDGDAYNNTFKPVLSAGFDPYNYELLIFNRWGEVLFESLNAAVGWDGNYGGKLCPEGTYVWQIRVKNGNGTFEQHRGFVHLLK